MITTMTAKYAGKCSVSGAPIRPGDSIRYDSISRKAWLHEPGDMDNPFGSPREATRPTRCISPKPFYQQTFSRRRFA